MSALPLAALLLTAPEAQSPKLAPAISVAGASGPGFLEMMIALTNSMPKDVDAAEAPGPRDASPKEKKPRNTEEAMAPPAQIPNLQTTGISPAPAGLEFALGQRVESSESEMNDKTPQAPVQANLPVGGPKTPPPLANTPPAPPPAKPIDKRETIQIAPAISEEIARVPMNTKESMTPQSIAPDAALSRPPIVCAVPPTQEDPVPQAIETAAPVRAESERRQPVPAPDVKISPIRSAVPHAGRESAAPAQRAPERPEPAPIDAPQPSTGRIIPPQTTPGEALMRTPVPAAIRAPEDYQVAPAPGSRQPVLTQESTIFPRTQTAFGARLVPIQPRPQHVTAETAASQGKHQHAMPDDPPAKPRAARLQTDDTPEEQPRADRSETVVPFTQAVDSANDGVSPESRTPEPPAAPRGEKVATTADHPKAPPAARDIKVELSGEDRKVEVRLVERAGEVHFAVRTPDGRLAGALREQLPALSSKLEQTGFRAEGWHASADSGPGRRLDVSSPLDTSGEERQMGGRQNGQEHREQEHPRARHTEELTDNEPKGQQFQWLFSSLR